MYWFAVDPELPEILDVGIRNGLWGVTEDARDEIDVLEPGDFILFFHRDDGFVLCEVESEPYTERVPVWTEVDFPHRVRISDPVETDRYAHLGEVHDCLLDPESGEPYSSTAKASAALEAAGGTFRPLSDEEIRCLFGRLGWTPPPGVDAAPVEEDEEPPDEEPPDEEEPDEEPADEGPPEADEPAVAEPVAEGPEPAEAEPAAAGPEEEGEAAPAEEEPAAPEATEEAPAPGEDEEPPAAETSEDEAEAAAPRVILAPAAGNEASRRRWEETVAEGVPVDRLEAHLPDDELETLRAASESGRVRVWGTAPARDEGSRAQWSDSGPGDVLLFTGGGEIFASARVLAKRRDPDLAEELWGRRDDGDTWEFLFFATEPLRQGVPYEAFNEVAGYEAGYRIPRLNILETGRSLRILGAFPEFALVPREGEDAAEAAEAPAEDEGAGEAVVEEDEAPAEAVEAGRPEEADEAEEAPEEPGPGEEVEPAAAADTPEPADAASADAGVGAMDEDRLRTLLFGRRELGRCALCGRLLPVELLDVVYVKPLEACDPQELEDVGNDVFPGCRLGCAGLFRQGYVVVEDGVVRPGREEPLTDPVEERVEEIVGNRCEYWHSGSEPYFRWHAAEVGDR